MGKLKTRDLIKFKAKNKHQLLFDFDEFKIIPVNPDDMPFFEKPSNDNERLLNLFKNYRAGDKQCLYKAYLLMVKVARKEIDVLCKKNKHLKELASEDRDEKAHNASTYIIELFLELPDFYIKDSATGYLYKRILFELFYKRDIDKIVFFTDLSALKI